MRANLHEGGELVKSRLSYPYLSRVFELVRNS